MRALHKERYTSRPSHSRSKTGWRLHDIVPALSVSFVPLSDKVTGTCPYGSKCRFSHDTSKVAICKRYFFTGACAKGDLCDLSHKPTYNRVPACTHYMSGNCTKDACRYAHVTVSPSSLICRPFALLGYCELGKACDKQHVFECPDFAETGHCMNDRAGKCKLQHVRHAHQERKRLRPDESSEVESSGDEDMKDDEEEDATSDIVSYGADGGSHDISQNQDYIPF